MKKKIYFLCFPLNEYSAPQKERNNVCDDDHIDPVLLSSHPRWTGLYLILCWDWFSALTLSPCWNQLLNTISYFSTLLIHGPT